MPDYVVYGTVPWDSPWLTEQNLAHALGKSRRVLYVEPPISPLSPIRYGLGHGTLRAARQLLDRRVRRDGRVHLVRPLAFPPLEHPRARRASAPLLRLQIRRAVARVGLVDPVVLACRSKVELVGAAGERAFVYLAKDLVDAGADYIGRDSRTLAAEEREICARADLVCVVTRELQRTFAQRGIDSVVIRHGFHADLAPAYDTAAPPSEYETLPRPLIGYAGRIDGRLDFDALALVADRLPNGSLVLIGPISPRLDGEELAPLISRPNVHLLGERRRAELPAYLRHLDCCVLPYREGEWGRHGSPLKLWDALYAGPPVVGSGYCILAEEPLVGYATPPALLPDAIQKALSESSDRRGARKRLALANSWDTRVVELEALLRTRLQLQT